MMKCLTYLFFVCILASCAGMQKQIPDNSRQFSDFIQRQKILSLPLTIDNYQNRFDGYDAIESDTLLLHMPMPMWYLGMLEDTSAYYYVISTHLGDGPVPQLNVFSKNGQLMDQARLMIGEYGPNCGVHVYGYTTISKDLKIYTQDSMAYYECDDFGNEYKDSLTIFIHSQKMEVLKDGSVAEGEKVETKIK